MPYPGTITKNRLGLFAVKAAAALPQTAQGTLFTISGGRVLLTQLVGEVTTVMGAVATNVSIIANPTVGADVPLSAVVATANDAVGILYSLLGDLTVALQKGAAVRGMTNPIVLPVGTLDLLTSASNTGAVKWKCFWMPLDDGAKLA